ncbi:hypothetical protein GWK47_024822 [Chionoecetes opilio]|uniref:Uncharacterized protein n=1 Tax=Chionoecetes opilio TaxID=41210 RepID=A0A8J4XM13_CHIOP|nr:hypothetical protein GWK47_024822 [Chionoecetes opilio]
MLILPALRIARIDHEERSIGFSQKPILEWLYLSKRRAGDGQLLVGTANVVVAGNEESDALANAAARRQLYEHILLVRLRTYARQSIDQFTPVGRKVGITIGQNNTTHHTAKVSKGLELLRSLPEIGRLPWHD